MILRRLRPAQGVKFAWLPVWTDEGLVWFERVQYRWNNTEFGSYSYRRLMWEPQYATLPADKDVTICVTPPDTAKCRELRTDGPTPCWYPKCTCMNVGGSTCGAQ